MDGEQKKSVFICYSKKNRDIANLYVEKLKNSAIIQTGISVEIGENFLTKAKEMLDAVDYIVILLTNEFLSCAWSLNELASILMQRNPEKYIVVRYPNVLIPGYLYNANIIEYNDIASHVDEDWNIPFLVHSHARKDKPTLSLCEALKVIRKSKSKPITVVCGAGVSQQPNWDSLLNTMIDRYLSASDYKTGERRSILKNLDVSGLQKAQFLQNVLKKDFYRLLGYELYNGTSNTESTIQSVTEFCTSCSAVKSVITYNFDLILEEQFQDAEFQCTPVCAKNKHNSIKGLPIYHVHGILDRNFDVQPRKYELVFSEKSYHTQYSEPYSWSNLLQLEKFTKDMCIFVGISLKDPNMRRLLDIAHRNQRSSQHLMIMKANPTRDFVDTMIEQNANELGVSIIWIDDFRDIPSILTALQSEIKRKAE